MTHHGNSSRSASRPATGDWRYLNGGSLVASGTLSVPLGVSRLVTSSGLSVGIPQAGAILIRRYSFSMSEIADTNFLVELSPISTSYESPSGTAFCTYSNEVFPAFRSQAGVVTNGMMLQKSGNGLLIVDDWLEFDEYFAELQHFLNPAANLASSFFIHSYAEIANTDGAAAHTVNFGESLSYEIWQRSFFE